jgi:glycerophosphoryl diester phosphodiesterase
MKQLRGFNYNRTKPEHFHADIPTLEEVLLYIRDKTNMTVNIELKTGVFFYPGIEEKTVGLVHAMGMEKRVIYSSFNHYSILYIKKLDPEAETGLLYSEGFVDVPAYAAKL